MLTAMTIARSMTSNAERVRRRLAGLGAYARQSALTHGKLLRSAVAISQTHTAAPARRHRADASGIGEV